ncbi:hypothetical protein BMF94_3530 [Rhodotorula taiwanensis]|uniref:Uncharacterized protein n=1 Tax=Rhodotorula taiwanensis TaxID=741276 RepID=A0A2S5B8V3_9BASI|nr:hypothetical protein BMF94_3530 [Rhodotorula taiwanensis]
MSSHSASISSKRAGARAAVGADRNRANDGGGVGSKGKSWLYWARRAARPVRLAELFKFSGLVALIRVSERRRAEIQEKRNRLAALKAAREQREAAARQALDASLSSATDDGAPPLPGSSRAASESAGERNGKASLGAASGTSRGDEIENLLRGVGVLGRDSAPPSPKGKEPLLRGSSPLATAARNGAEGTASPAPAVVENDSPEGTPNRDQAGAAGAPSLEAPDPASTATAPASSSTSTSIQTEPAPPPPLPTAKPKIVYDKAIQTAFDSESTVTRLNATASTSTGPSVTSGAEPSASTGGAGRETAEELRARILAELEDERKRLDAEIAREKLLAEQALERDRARGLSGDQLQHVFASPAFADFLEQSTKVVQRALSDPYDYLRDYSISADDGADADESKRARVRLLGVWQDQQWGRGRSVTSVDWSPKFPELFVAAYNRKPLSINEPDGIAAVWNLHLQDRPEYVRTTFRWLSMDQLLTCWISQSDILSIAFSPFNSNLVVGGTYSGQILLWDTRSRNPNPVLKTPLSTSGHTHPVYSLAHLGTQNANSLVSASTDGVVCAWSLDMLARPQETLELLHPAHSKTDEVSITSVGFPLGEASTFWCGTEEGNVYAAHRYDRAGAKAGLVQNEVYRGHSGPVTGLDFHPAEGSVDLSDLFLTSGVDWTVKLWRAGGANPARTAAGGAGSSSKVGTPTNGTGASSTRSGLSSSLGRSASGPPPPGTIAPLFTFEEAGDYVYDVRWHPVHPAVFGSVDAAGKFNLWNLNVDTEVPLVSTAVGDPARPRGLNKLAWEKKEGRRAAVGSSDGKVYIYDISPDLVTPREADWDQMRRTCKAALADQQNPDAYR